VAASPSPAQCRIAQLGNAYRTCLIGPANAKSPCATDLSRAGFRGGAYDQAVVLMLLAVLVLLPDAVACAWLFT
jgi:hypothetical protein